MTNSKNSVSYKEWIAKRLRTYFIVTDLATYFMGTLHPEADSYASNFNNLEYNDVYNTQSGILQRSNADQDSNVSLRNKTADPNFKVGRAQKRNALAHAYAAAKMAYYYGPGTAIELGYYVEAVEAPFSIAGNAVDNLQNGDPLNKGVSASAANSSADIRNNLIGSYIGEYARKNNLPIERIQSLVKWAYDNGWLAVNPDGNGTQKSTGTSSDLVVIPNGGSFDDFKRDLDIAAKSNADVGLDKGANVVQEQNFAGRPVVGISDSIADVLRNISHSLEEKYDNIIRQVFVEFNKFNSPVIKINLIDVKQTSGSLVVVGLRYAPLLNGSGYFHSGDAGSLKLISIIGNDFKVKKSIGLEVVLWDGSRQDAKLIQWDESTPSSDATSFYRGYIFDEDTRIRIATSRNNGDSTITITTKSGIQIISAPTDATIVYTPASTQNGVERLASISVSNSGSDIGSKYIIDSNGVMTVAHNVSVEHEPIQVGKRVPKGNNGNDLVYSGAVIGDIIGSSLGNYLAKGEALKGIVYSSVLGQIGKNLARGIEAAFSGASLSTVINTATAGGLDGFVAGTWQKMQGAAIGTASSMLAVQLAQSLGLKGFGGELFTTVASTGTNAVIQQVIANLNDGVPNNPFEGLFGNGALSSGELWGSSIAGFLGAKLGSILVRPETEAGAVLSTIGSSIGSFIAMSSVSAAAASAAAASGLTAAGMATAAGASMEAAAAAGAAAAASAGTISFSSALIATGWGALIGFVLGALIGNLFGKKKPRTPTASAETVLQIPYAQYALGSSTSANGGNLNLVKGMATNARDILNGLINQVTYGDEFAQVSNLNGVGTTQTYGHTGNQLYVKINGAQHNVISADEAVEYGTLAAIRNTKVISGDLFLKRAIANSIASDLTAFSGDLTTAKDYAFYGNNKALINGYIKDAFATLSEVDKAFYDGRLYNGVDYDDNNKALVDKILTGGTDALNTSELSTYNANKPQFDRVLSAVGAQTVANPWIITLLRASELKLDQWSTSDFYGGLKGFMDSFNVRAIGYENVSVSANGAGAFLTVKTPGQTAGVFDVLPQALISPDSNDIKDGGLSDIPSNWQAASWLPSGHAWAAGLRTDEWSGSGNSVIFAYQAGVSSGELVDQRSAKIASQAGVTYEASVYAAQHRGAAQAILEFWNSSDQVIGSILLNGTAMEGGSLHGDLSQYNLLSVTATAPVGTAYRRLNLRLCSTGGADPHAFFTRPMTRSVTVGNQIANDHFFDPVTGANSWGYATNATVAVQHGVNLNADWSGSGNDVLWAYMPGVTSGQVVDQWSNWIDVKPGEVTETSVYAAQHRGVAQVWVVYADANWNSLGWYQVTGTARENGGYHGDINNFNKITGTTTAPTTAAHRQVVLRLVSNGVTDPFAFFTLPVSRPVSYATPNWEDSGHSVWINNMGLVGYDSSGSITAGNDLIDRSNFTAGTTIDDSANGGDDIFIGGQGNDVLYGRAGSDWLDGGAGNDFIYGGDGNDVLIGGAGNDNLYGEGGDDYIAAGDGSDASYGGDGNDILADGQGSECLLGQNGDDTLLVAEDHTFNWFWGGDENSSSDPNGKDTISAERVTVGVSFDIDLRPSDWNGSTDFVAGNSASRLAVVANAQTGVWITNEGLLGIENATGSQYGDILYGTEGANVLKGLAGDDKLYGRGGDDTIEGGAGADMLYGGGGYDCVSYHDSTEGVYVNLTTGETYGGDADGDTLTDIEGIKGSRLSDELKGNSGDNWILSDAGDDWIVYTDGNDTYDGGAGSDTLDFSDVTTSVDGSLVGLGAGQQCGVWVNIGATLGGPYVGWRPSTTTFWNIENIVGTKFIDHIHGDGGDNQIEGGQGNDYLAGWGGADTYYFSRGDGQDTIGSDTNADNNTITLGADIKFSDLWIGSAGGTGGYLTVGIRGTSDQIYDTGNFGTRNNNIIKTLDMNGAAQVDISQIDFVRGGGDGNDTINGTNSYSDWILGFNGDDTITGSGTMWEDHGNVIIGGLGYDTIRTSTGDDQFLFDRGDGRDDITDAGGEDTIVFGSSVAAEDVIFEVLGPGLYIGLRDVNDPTKKAHEVSDFICVMNGGAKYRLLDPEDPSNVISETQNTVEFVIAGGTTIDIRKLDIQWFNVDTWYYDYNYPIAFDLGADGLDLSSVEDSDVVVKTTGGGLSRVSWIGPEDGFLAVDRDGDGSINKLSEISFVQDKKGAKSDLEGLMTWDTNGDNLLDKKDLNFNKLLLWVDANQNGRSTKKELKTLTEAGIVAIDLKGQATGYTSNLGIDSFVQNKMSFIWADGKKGDAYDVALARRVLGSEGLNAGAYQAEWGARNEDGTMGRLQNDPKALAIADRIAAKRGLLDQIGASYNEVKAKAQIDFTDNDKVDAKIAIRWAKKTKTEQAAWLSGTEVMDLAKIKVISSSQGLKNTLADAQKATNAVKNKARQQATSTLATTSGSSIASSSTGDASASPSGAGTSLGQTASLGLTLTASEPDLRASSGQAPVSNSSQAWWLTGASEASVSGGNSLSKLLSSMNSGATSTPTATTSSSDQSLTQQQLLLLQAMASFGGKASGGETAATWSRTATASTASMAAASLTPTDQKSLVAA